MPRGKEQASVNGWGGVNIDIGSPWKIASRFRRMMAGESEALTPSVEAPACSREKVDAVAGSKEVPLAGKMVQIKRKVGDNVETDETALALENMKMENTAMAPESCRLGKYRSVRPIT